MSIVLQNPLPNLSHQIKSHFSNTTHFNSSKSPKLSNIQYPFQLLRFNKYPSHNNLYLSHNPHFYIKAHDSSLTSIDQDEKTSSKLSTFDHFLSLMESTCVVSSMVISVGCVVNWVFFKKDYNGLVLLGNRVVLWLLVGAVAAGYIIRRRQWRRVCGSDSRSKPGFESGNVIERIENLEESMKTVSSIIRMLSRKLEKLGIRFRVTRKAIKDPISETAALAQKNSEATRALKLQEDMLEREIAEVQKVLLAMQDQQEKQLELILAIAKSGDLLKNKRALNQGATVNKKDSNNSPSQVDGKPIQAVSGQKDASNNKLVES
ncbi:hypothetical protein KSS87_019566 [Heliosperma pusillum]|nr:hypothetical protein KSS87_019566 [Heliosperma pusillum]